MCDLQRAISNPTKCYGKVDGGDGKAIYYITQNENRLKGFRCYRYDLPHHYTLPATNQLRCIKHFIETECEAIVIDDGEEFAKKPNTALTILSYIVMQELPIPIYFIGRWWGSTCNNVMMTVLASRAKTFLTKEEFFEFCAAH
jgi:hypothetical protein